jgi:hypothetical protein
METRQLHALKSMKISVQSVLGPTQTQAGTNVHGIDVGLEQAGVILVSPDIIHSAQCLALTIASMPRVRIHAVLVPNCMAACERGAAGSPQTCLHPDRVGVPCQSLTDVLCVPGMPYSVCLCRCIGRHAMATTRLDHHRLDMPLTAIKSTRSHGRTHGCMPGRPIQRQWLGSAILCSQS